MILTPEDVLRALPASPEVLAQRYPSCALDPVVEDLRKCGRVRFNRTTGQWEENPYEIATWIERFGCDLAVSRSVPQALQGARDARHVEKQRGEQDAHRILQRFKTKYRDPAKSNPASGPLYFALPNPIRVDRRIFWHPELDKHKALWLYVETRGKRLRSLRQVTAAHLRSLIDTRTPETCFTFYVFDEEMVWCIACPWDTDRHDREVIFVSGERSQVLL